jgi:hypothetical protein
MPIKTSSAVFGLCLGLVCLAISTVASAPVKPYTEPLSDAEIEAMAKDAPSLIQIITDNHLLVANGSFVTKSYMDVVGPIILEILDRIDKAQAQLPKTTEVRQNTTDVRMRFLRDWKSCNDTQNEAIPTIGVKLMLDKLQLHDLRTTLRTMTVDEQVKMRALLTHARDRVLETKNVPFAEKYIESTKASIANIFQTASDLASSLKEIRFQVMMHRADKAAKARVKTLWKEAEQQYLQRMVPAGEYRA